MGGVAKVAPSFFQQGSLGLSAKVSCEMQIFAQVGQSLSVPSAKVSA